MPEITPILTRTPCCAPNPSDLPGLVLGLDGIVPYPVCTVCAGIGSPYVAPPDVQIRLEQLEKNVLDLRAKRHQHARKQKALACLCAGKDAMLQVLEDAQIELPLGLHNAADTDYFLILGTFFADDPAYTSWERELRAFLNGKNVGHAWDALVGALPALLERIRQEYPADQSCEAAHLHERLRALEAEQFREAEMILNMDLFPKQREHELLRILTRLWSLARKPQHCYAAALIPQLERLIEAAGIRF